MRQPIFGCVLNIPVAMSVLTLQVSDGFNMKRNNISSLMYHYFLLF